MTAPATDLTTIPNIGPAIARSLIAAGITDAETFRRLGADAAYRALLANGERPHFIGYYVLHMSIQGRPWNDCRGTEKEALRAAFDHIIADAKKADPMSEIEESLNLLGIGLRR